MDIRQWEMRSFGEPLAASRRRVESLAAGEALVRVAGCGVCHTDLGFWLGEARTGHALPLVLGHEISGVVEDAGSGARAWIGRPVVVPAVLPCGECGPCRRGRYALCPNQVFPGSDAHGGFASHVVVPARFLCEAPAADESWLPLLAVAADAASTPFEAVRRSGLTAGDLAVFVGAGGVGGFGVQIARALGASVIAVDPAEERRRLALAHGAVLALDPRGVETAALKKTVRAFVRERGLPETEWKIFETSGTPDGQELAFDLLVRGGHLAVVGYTSARVTVALGHLMALDARAEGNWGCAPARYPEVLRMIEDGRVVVEPFVERRPMSEINAVLNDMREHRLQRRAVLIPDF